MENKITKWKEKIIYQIFPRSFYDSNNDGSGDIKGITLKLDYLKELGITAIWLCPTYETRFADAGYDVIDYKTVWSQFGTLDDFKEMTKEAAKRGIDIIMDIVLNHVSNEHPWFVKGSKDVNSKEHNYFIWRETLNDDEKDAPSIFGGSGWEYVPAVKKYYFHLFAKEQVDLNWEHPDTIEAMAGVIDFWYEIGVKGFRLDAIKHISKEFPQGIPYHAWCSTAVPQLQKFNKRAFDNKPDAFVLGEASGINVEEAIKYGTGEQKVSDNYYNFCWWHIGWDNDNGGTGRNGFGSHWNYKDFLTNMAGFQHNEAIGPELMTNFLSNHDTSRAISRWGDENFFWRESAKTFAMLMMIMKGMPSIYYGEEIGMLNPVFKDRSEFRDVDALNSYRNMVDKEKLYTEEEMTIYHNINGRDNCRTPMQWDDSVNAGFNKGKETWIKVGKTYKDINVASQIKDKDSIFSFYKLLISMRKDKKFKDILIDGKSKLELLDNGVFKVTRTLGNKSIIALLNITKEKKQYEPESGEVIARSWADNKKLNNQLRSYESIMFFKG